MSKNGNIRKCEKIHKGGNKLKRFIILLAILLVYTSSFPSSLLAKERSNDEIEETTNDEEEKGDNESFADDNDLDNNGELQEKQSIKEGNKDPKEGKSANGNKNKESNEKSTQKKENGSNEDDKETETDKDEKKEDKSESKEETDEYNEFGIKKGREVYGEDISELTEEELQYIPKAWREGKFESEHPDEPKNDAGLFTNYPDVNKYIASNNLSAPKIEYNHISHLTKFNYRNGNGKPEGLVAHETANSNSTITSEINYMSNNHENAFVHAFIDGSRIIEVHPTDYGAWGAGRFANERFMHVELVQTNSFGQFARSINNYSEYIALMLYKYDLGVTSAEKSGKGTLWSHDAVSKFLGGTNHVDPHGYFAKWGYNWDDFVKLVDKKYDELALAKISNTSKLGHIKSSNVRIYNDPSSLIDYSNAGSKHMNEVYYIKSEAKTNNATYYLISKQPSKTNGTIGWIKSTDMNIHVHKGKDKKSKKFIVKGTGKAYNKTWGGTKNLVYDLSSYAGSTFKVNLTETVGNNTWYRGKLNGKQVWIHSSYLLSDSESKTSKLGHVRGSAVKIYKNLDNLSSTIKAGSKYTDSVYYIKKEAKINNQLYYLISNEPSSVEGTVGWVKSQDLSTHPHVGVNKKAKTFYINGAGNAYSRAWGGDKNLVYDLEQYKSQKFKVYLTEKVGNNIWYRGKLNGKTVWLHSSYVYSKKESKTSRLGHVRNSNVNIYEDIDNLTSAKTAGNKYTDSVYYIKKQAKIDDQLYYLISNEPSSTEGTIGWVKSQDLSTHLHVGVNKKSKKFYVKGSGNAYNRAWGGNENLIYNLTEYKNQEFKVHLTEKVGNNTWYRGTLNGKTVWMHSSYVTSKEESKISRLGHIRNSKVAIYKDIGNPSTALTAGNTYTHSVYYIKKQASVNNQLYYLISNTPSSNKGAVGWVKSQDLSTHMHTGVDKSKKTFTFKGTGSAYSKAWGGSKNEVLSNLSQYKGQKFNVHLTEKVGNNIWYRGDFNGQRIWVHHSYVK